MLLLGLIALVVINSGWATEGGPLDIARYFPEGPLVFARTPDLKKLLPAIKNHPLEKLYAGSEAAEKFHASKLYLKLADRFKEAEKLSGIRLSYEKILEVAGGESGLALYDIGDLKMVFLTAAPRDKVLKSEFGSARDRFEERRKGDQLYYVITNESGAVFAFAMVDRWLLVSNDLKRFERSLALIGGAGEDNLAGDPRFKSAVPESFHAGDLTIVLDQESLNDNLYFKTYWLYRNASALRWISSETLNLKFGSGVIEEQRWFGLNEDAAGAPSHVNVSDLARWPRNSMWLDVSTNSDASEISSYIAKWAMGDRAGGVGDYVAQIANMIEPAKPVAVARLAAPRVEGAGFWLDERRLVAIKLGAPRALKGSDLRAAIAKRWSDMVGAGGLINASFAAHNGVETLSLPLMEGAGPAILEKDGLLIISNDAGLIREYVSAPPAPGFETANDTFTRVEVSTCAAHFSRLYRILARRSNWKYNESESFFSEEAPSFLKAVGGVKLALIRGRRADKRYIEEVRYELAAGK